MWFSGAVSLLNFFSWKSCAALKDMVLFAKKKWTTNFLLDLACLDVRVQFNECMLKNLPPRVKFKHAQLKMKCSEQVR